MMIKILLATDYVYQILDKESLEYMQKLGIEHLSIHIFNPNINLCAFEEEDLVISFDIKSNDNVSYYVKQNNLNGTPSEILNMLLEHDIESKIQDIQINIPQKGFLDFLLKNKSLSDKEKKRLRRLLLEHAYPKMLRDSSHIVYTSNSNIIRENDLQSWINSQNTYIFITDFPLREIYKSVIGIIPHVIFLTGDNNASTLRSLYDMSKSVEYSFGHVAKEKAKDSFNYNLALEIQRFIKPLPQFKNKKEMPKIFKKDIDEVKIKKVAQSNANIMLVGETGTGKNVIARYIHEQSNRKLLPFITVHLAGIPETLLENELFGHEPGAFTSADSKKPKIGYFEKASGGTIFLDEIESISAETQVKLLRVLQDRVIVRLGGLDERPVDLRIIAATNQNLLNMVKQGKFRADLYYRLCTINIYLSPLRGRADDIEDLIDYFISENRVRIDEKGKEYLKQHNFPGNVRELQHILERASILCENNTITMEDLQLDDVWERFEGDKEAGGENSSAEAEREKLTKHFVVLEKQIIEEYKYIWYNVLKEYNAWKCHRPTPRTSPSIENDLKLVIAMAYENQETSFANRDYRKINPKRQPYVSEILSFWKDKEFLIATDSGSKYRLNQKILYRD